MRLTLLLITLVASSACGPFAYVTTVTRSASSEVDAARALDADRWAPYEYTLALEYLRKAREEAGYSDYQAALRFGKMAKVSAQRAQELAKARAADPIRAARELPIEIISGEKGAASQDAAEDAKSPPSSADPSGEAEIPDGLLDEKAESVPPTKPGAQKEKSADKKKGKKKSKKKKRSRKRGAKWRRAKKKSSSGGAP